MSKHHTTVTRRDFMKGLGLAGAGLGAAAATAPVFHDLDELISAGDIKSDPWANFKRPWWVKEREFKNPTTEVDWNIMQPWDYNYEPCNTQIGNTRHGQYAPYGVNDDQTRADMERMAKSKAGRLESMSAELNKGTPGFTLRDVGLDNGSSRFPLKSIPWVGEDRDAGGKSMTPSVIGQPKWSGTPEENTNMLRAAAHFFGAANVGALELDADTKKLYYPTKNRFEDVSEPYEDGSVRVIPSKCRWAVCYVVRQSNEMSRRGLTCQNTGSNFGYCHGPLIEIHLKRFIRTLGYFALSGGMNVPMGVLCGVSELGRLNYQVTPEWGGAVRYSPALATDLPLAPTKPIDAGIWKFCEVCKVCANFCQEMNDGITPMSLADEPSWEPSGPWNRAGVKKYHCDWPKCLRYCLYCQTACPFSAKGSASVHEIIKATVATTPIFNSFFTNMENIFYETPQRDEEDFIAWWERDLRTWPYDPIYV